jgi:hypothetical protein
MKQPNQTKGDIMPSKERMKVDFANYDPNALPEGAVVDSLTGEVFESYEEYINHTNKDGHTPKDIEYYPADQQEQMRAASQAAIERGTQRDAVAKAGKEDPAVEAITQAHKEVEAIQGKVPKSRRY